MSRQIENITGLTDATITSVLSSVNTTNYPATIAGQTDRIADAHEIIQKRAVDMALNVKASEGDSKPASARLLADGDKIMDTASAINSINIQDRLIMTSSNAYVTADVNTTASATYTVPVGYNKTLTTIKFTRPTLSGTASAADVLTGKTFYNTSYTKVTGTMLDMSGDNAASVNTTGGTLSLVIPATGKYTKDDKLTTNIAVQTPSAKLWDSTGKENTTATENVIVVPVEVKNTTGEGINDSYIVTGKIPAGYYPNAVSIYPVLSTTTTNKRINIQATKAATQANHASITPDSGFDYLSEVTVPNVAGSVQTDGTYKVTTAGWIAAGTYGTPFAGLTDTELSWKTSATSGKTYTDKTISAKESWIDIAEGKISDTYQKVIVADAKASLSAAITGTLTQKPVISKNSTAANSNITTVSIGTTKPSSGYYVAVGTAAKTSTITATSSCTLTTAGWLGTAPANATKTASVGAAASEVTYIAITPGVQTISDFTKASADIKAADGTTVLVEKDKYYIDVNTTTAGWIPAGHQYKQLSLATGTHTIGQLTKATAAITDGTTTLVAKDAYYVKCSTTAGYQPASDTYITIATGSATKTGVSHATNKFTGKVTLTAGYYPAGDITLTDFTVKDASSLSVTRSGTSIPATTYFTANTTVSVASAAGVLADGSGTSSNILTSDGVSATSATSKLENLSADTTFYATGDGTNKRYFSSFKVEVNDTIAALQAI